MQFDPLWFFRAPLGGDVAQRFNTPWFSPSYTINYAGNATIEERIISDVASYGKQIGWLNEVVLALAKGTAVPEEIAETLHRMTVADEKIKQIKAVNKQTLLDTAIDALDRLQKEQPDAYDELMRRRKM